MRVMGDKVTKDRKRVLFGSFCGVMTGICWGVSGVWGQFLFETRGIDSNWIVPIRLFSGGIVLLIYMFLKNREQMVTLVKNKRDFLQAILTGVLGTMMFQLTFFGAVQRSNAGTATVLQYLCPVMTMIYVCMRDKKKPEKIEVLSIILALAGIFVISTHGNPNALAITPDALIWGIATAFFMFMSTVLPEGLYKKYSSMVVLSWGFLIGGIIQLFIFKPWEYDVKIDIMVIIAMLFIVLGGCVFSYVFYGNAIKRIGAARSSLFAASEPIAAALLSAVWLKTEFLLIDLLGFALILSTIFLLTKPDAKPAE